MYPKIILHQRCDITVLSLHLATEKIPTSKIRWSPHYPSEWAVEDAGPPPAFKCSLRSVLTFTSCLSTTLVGCAHSSLLTPHSSFLPLFLHNTNTPITFGTAISPLKISDTPHTSSMLHIVPTHPHTSAISL